MKKRKELRKFTRAVLLMTIALTVLSACGTASETRETGQANGPGEAQEMNTGAESAVGANGVASDSLCYNEFYPLVPDKVRRYGVLTGKTAESEDYSDPPTVYKKRQSYSGEDSFTEILEFSNGIEPAVKWECTSEGLGNDQLFGYLKGPGGTNQVEMISSSGVYLPKSGWKVGAKWSYEVKVKIKSGSTAEGDILNTARIDYEIKSMDDKVKVPGGEFTAARLDSVSNMDIGIPGRPDTQAKLMNSEWYAPGIGLVKVVQTGFNTATTVYLGDEEK